jgi:hypothetical protein
MGKNGGVAAQAPGPQPPLMRSMHELPHLRNPIDLRESEDPIDPIDAHKISHIPGLSPGG